MLPAVAARRPAAAAADFTAAADLRDGRRPRRPADYLAVPQAQPRPLLANPILDDRTTELLIDATPVSLTKFHSYY
eukprot:SAG31_NODE_67_length_28318_cov_6.493674_27_plen_76_part_00